MGSRCATSLVFIISLRLDISRMRAGAAQVVVRQPAMGCDRRPAEPLYSFLFVK